ncbi:DUF1453 family protein [Streptomyces antnestii]|uniref:DUF1453 family protein n=1 Tax=Streptomyces antnestii TaxID=2494256 RepID=A0A437Q1M4_9ACTN|nr:DUF1453 family protein [Streptomyces sp. San01]RVU28353.1 DUF1453 family protein [Streptomyces sp. San01]
MSGFTNVLVIIAVVVLVVARQFTAQQITADKRWWVVPAVLVFMAVRKPDLLDPYHQALSAALIGLELLVGLAIGAGWAWTTRLWTAQDGAVWSRSTKASGAVWIVGVAIRVGLYAAGAAFGVKQGSAALMLALAATLLVRSGVLVWRAQSLRPAPQEATAYGDGVRVPTWKDRV